MSSIIGIRGNAGQSSYAASKAGIIGFTKSIAAEIGSRNIRCNAIAPGFIETEMTGHLSDDDLAPVTERGAEGVDVLPLFGLGDHLGVFLFRNDFHEGELLSGE